MDEHISRCGVVTRRPLEVRLRYSVRSITPGSLPLQRQVGAQR